MYVIFSKSLKQQQMTPTADQNYKCSFFFIIELLSLQRAFPPLHNSIKLTRELFIRKKQNGINICIQITFFIQYIIEAPDCISLKYFVIQEIVQIFSHICGKHFYQ